MILRAAIVLALAVVPSIARACPACVDPREANSDAFLSMTIFLSLLPLTMIGVIVYVVAKSRTAVDQGESISTVGEPSATLLPRSSTRSIESGPR